MLNVRAPAAQQAWAGQFLRLHVGLQPGFNSDVVNIENAKLRIPDLDIDRRYFQLQGNVTVTIVDKRVDRKPGK